MGQEWISEFGIEDQTNWPEPVDESAIRKSMTGLDDSGDKEEEF